MKRKSNAMAEKRYLWPVLFGTAVVACFLLLLFALREHFLPRLFETPSSIDKPGVKLDRLGMTKREMFVSNALGRITSIGGYKIGGEEYYVLAASNEAAIINAKGKQIKAVEFPSAMETVDILPSSDNSSVRYLSRRGALKNRESMLVDSEGRIVWRYGEGSPGVNDAAWGDIDGDGRLEYIVGFNGTRGLHLINENGELIWKLGEKNIWHVEMVDINNDNNAEIVHSNGDRKIVFRDSSGSILQEFSPSTNVTRFAMASFYKKKERYVLVPADGTLKIFDLFGKLVLELQAPHCSTLGAVKSLPIRMNEKQEGQLVVLVEYMMWNRSILYIYSALGELQYIEILSSSGQGLANGEETGEKETFLVGLKGKVLQYIAKQ